MRMSPITCVEFQQIQQLLCEHCGIYLHDNQAYLVQARLSHYASRLGAQNFSDLITKLHANPEKLLPNVVNLMTTNETWWFRETSCWNALEKRILPDFIDRLSCRPIPFIRIWIAGCSAGQEAYSLAMLIDELCASLHQPQLSKRFAIEAMDISETALTIARHAIYSAAEMRRGLSPTRQAPQSGVAPTRPI
jgi:chemotaxis protein methyltransferase CheR